MNSQDSIWPKVHITLLVITSIMVSFTLQKYAP